jgi:hypothetical protein
VNEKLWRALHSTRIFEGKSQLLRIETMNKIFHSLRVVATVLIALTVCLAVSAPARAQHAHMTPVLSSYLKMVFSGDTSAAAELFVSDPEESGSRMLADRFERRFIERSDGLDLTRLESPAVREIADLYEAYWLDALMQKAPLDLLESRLKSRLDDLLIERGFASALEDEDALFDNVEAFIRGEGYFAQSGRTPPLLDLMIWTSNDTVVESVELTDGVYEVDLNYLDDFVSYGWSNFATFGMAGAGGWAEKDGLYCIRRHYDLDSEKFKLSFLKHEARHFADYELYPELQPADLEYRGKLTELAYSEEGTYRLLEDFTKGANRVENAPHPLANWYVVEGLSRQLLGGEPPADASGWESIPKEQIRQAARRLLEEHDGMLADLGPANAKGVINL